MSTTMIATSAVPSRRAASGARGCRCTRRQTDSPAAGGADAAGAAGAACSLDIGPKAIRAVGRSARPLRISAIALQKQLKIGIDARAAAEEPAGRGRYVRELLRALAALDSEHEPIAYGRTAWGDLPGVNWRLIPGGDPVWHLRAARAASRECDVYLSTNSYLT